MSGLMILVNLHYPLGSSFHTITKDLLGKAGVLLMDYRLRFVLYILTYAYISAGSSIIVQNFAEVVSVPKLLQV